MRDWKWDYTIRAFLAPNQGGGLLFETTHSSLASRDIEIAACQARMARGEIDHIDVISHVEPFGVTTLLAVEDPRVITFQGRPLVWGRPDLEMLHRLFKDCRRG